MRRALLHKLTKQKRAPVHAEHIRVTFAELPSQQRRREQRWGAEAAAGGGGGAAAGWGGGGAAAAAGREAAAAGRRLREQGRSRGAESTKPRHQQPRHRRRVPLPLPFRRLISDAFPPYRPNAFFRFKNRSS